MLRLPEHDWRHREGFALTDQGMNTQQALDQVNYCIWCHTQGKDSCSQGLKDRKTGAVPEVGVRRHPRRLPAGREDLRNAHAARRRSCAGRLRHDRHRQPDDGGHRPPHLQRLHEGLHLPEAGGGRHPAGRDQRPEGRAGAALGFRDLRPADALESARHPPPPAAPRQRPQGADRRPRPGRLHPGASSDERRPHHRRGGRPEDRAARLRPVDPGARRRNPVRKPRRPRDGRLRRRRRVRHHCPLEQELPEARPPAAGTPRQPVRPFRRHPLRRRRHLVHRRRLGDGLRPHRPVHGRRQADRAGHPERPGPRRAPGLRLPDGAATDRRRQNILHRQPAAPPAGGGHRRRPDRDRHRDRKPRLLCPAGGEIRPALSHPCGRKGRDGRAPALDRRRSRNRQRIPGPRRRHPRRTRKRRNRGPPTQPRRPAGQLGRRHHRLSPPPGRQPILHAEPRGSRQGDGRSRPLRRGPDPASPSKPTATATPPPCA